MTIDPIKADRVLIRSLKQSDMRDLHLLESDSEVKRYLGGPTKHSLSEYEEGYLKRQTDPYGSLAIEEGSSGQLIGRCGLMNRVDSKELAIVLAKSAWGKGYGTETGYALISFAFKILGVQLITGITDPKNADSRRLLKKLGLKPAGEPGEGTSLIHTITLDMWRSTPSHS